jgi:hypothetical protein
VRGQVGGAAAKSLQHIALDASVQRSMHALGPSRVLAGEHACWTGLPCRILGWGTFTALLYYGLLCGPFCELLLRGLLCGLLCGLCFVGYFSVDYSADSSVGYSACMWTPPPWTTVRTPVRTPVACEDYCADYSSVDYCGDYSRWLCGLLFELRMLSEISVNYSADYSLRTAMWTAVRTALCRLLCGILYADYSRYADCCMCGLLCGLLLYADYSADSLRRLLCGLRCWPLCEL